MKWLVGTQKLPRVSISLVFHFCVHAELSRSETGRLTFQSAAVEMFASPRGLKGQSAQIATDRSCFTPRSSADLAMGMSQYLL